jgi:hypothetical protein
LAAATGSEYTRRAAAVDAVAGAICIGAVVRGVQVIRAGRAAAAASRATTRVMGHYPEYLQVGEALGAKVFSMPTQVFDAMPTAAQKAANMRFLDRGIAEGAEFVMATRRADVRAGSALADEVQYLLNKGYKWTDNNMSLVPK